MVSKSKLWTCTGTARTGANPEKARCLHTKLDLGTVSQIHHQSFTTSGIQALGSGLQRGLPKQGQSAARGLGRSCSRQSWPALAGHGMSAPVLIVDGSDRLTEFGPGLA